MDYVVEISFSQCYHCCMWKCGALF
uniref:Uncharacterized protein n=1 Tax=Rhizophora mucronata TaxID=61149 RepID=A0A2P2PB76_RHIMU